MTEKSRRRFYFPAWSRCCHANDWRGKSCPRQRWIGPEFVQDLYDQVWAGAERRARHAERPVTEDDLRHGCHIVAVGRDASCKSLTAAEADRVVALFRVLADPDDIDAMINWTDPDRAGKRRTIGFIRGAAPEAYIRHVSGHKFGSEDWEDLTIVQLRQLAITMSERRRVREGAR